VCPGHQATEVAGPRLTRSITVEHPDLDWSLRRHAQVHLRRWQACAYEYAVTLGQRLDPIIIVDN